MYSGFKQIQNSVLNAKLWLKRIKDAIIWIARNANFIFVGYVWQIGLSMAQQQADTLLVIFMIKC